MINDDSSSLLQQPPAKSHVRTNALSLFVKMLPIVGAIVTFDHFLHNILCDAIFGCGCVYGSDENCNIWNEAGEGEGYTPRCPYCLANATVGFWTTLVIPLTAAVVAGATIFLKLPRAKYPVAALLALFVSLTSYLLAYLIVAGVFFATVPEYGYFAGVGEQPPHRFSTSTT